MKPVMTSEYMLQLFSENVRRLRLEAGLTQANLAERCRPYQRHIAQIEDGRARVTLRMIVALAQALNVTPGVLLRSDPQAREPDAG